MNEQDESFEIGYDDFLIFGKRMPNGEIVNSDIDPYDYECGFVQAQQDYPYFSSAELFE